MSACPFECFSWWSKAVVGLPGDVNDDESNSRGEPSAIAKKLVQPALQIANVAKIKSSALRELREKCSDKKEKQLVGRVEKICRDIQEPSPADGKRKKINSVLKKLLETIEEAFENNFVQLVNLSGNLVGNVVCWLYPLPEYQVLTVQEVGANHEIKYVTEELFFNYAETVKTTPSVMYFPRSVRDIQHLVKITKEKGLRLRCCGMRHSWTPVFPDDGSVLISMLPLEVTDTLAHTRGEDSTSMEEKLRAWNSQLSFISFEETLPDENGLKKARVKVGAATTNLEMLRWSEETKWTLPWDIIAVMITYGGSNATICHGAGLKSRTLSDLVLEMEFVNYNGELQTISDAETLKSAAGCFGLLGVVTSITFKMDEMTYANWLPKKLPMHQALPRPTGDKTVQPHLVDKLEQNYYTEFFWFPNNGVENGYWENCWNNDGKESESRLLNEQIDSEFQINSTYLLDFVTDVLVPVMQVIDKFDRESDYIQNLVHRLFSRVVAVAGISAMPETDKPYTTPLVEALHFKQGFHYISVREMEIEIPIPDDGEGNPDYSIVQRAWWDAVEIIERHKEFHSHPCDMTLEMRVMGSSEITLAPYKGNPHGTVSIEPVSTSVVSIDLWEKFKVELANVWFNYKSNDGKPLKVRPHWAKELPEYVEYDGKRYSGTEYLKMIYSDDIQVFKKDIQSVCSKGGYQIVDLKSLFSNKYLDDIFQDLWTEME